jgi:hypothetical protein
MWLTSKQVIKLLEDFIPSSYPVGNVSNYNYLNRDKIIDLINTKTGFAEKALIDLLKTDYSYYISGEFNPFFNKVKAIINDGKAIDKTDSNKLKQILTKDYIDLLVQTVNFSQLPPTKVEGLQKP